MTFKEMAKHLLHFQQVYLLNIFQIFYDILKVIFTIFVTLKQAGLTSLEVKFTEWEWEEELHVFTLEDVGLGKTFCRMKPITMGPPTFHEPSDNGVNQNKA